MTVYSPKELSMLYNRIKITHNPSGYSFKDRLIEQSIRGLEDSLTVNVDYCTENDLVTKIREFWKESGSPLNYGRLHSADYSRGDFEGFVCQLLGLDANIISPMEHSALVVSTDHISFTPVEFAKIFEVDTATFKKSNVLEGIITACYMLTTPKSIASDLKWTCTGMPAKFNYETLHSMQFLKDALEKKDITEVHVVRGRSVFENINCPHSREAGATHPSIDFADTEGILEPAVDFKDVDKIKYHELLRIMYLETIAFGLEFAYVINNYTSSYTNRLVYEVCVGSKPLATDSLASLMFKVGKSEFVPAIDLDNVPEIRFKQIQDYINSEEVNAMVETMTVSFMERHGYYALPHMLGAILSFAKNHSYRNIRIKQCAILYNYCKANKLIGSHKSSEDPLEENDDGDDDSGFFAGVRSGISELESAETKSKSMLDLREERKARIKAAPGGGHDGSTVSQALDGLIDNFRTDKYGFTIKETYTDNEDARRKYEAIASKVKIVNSQLIKQIRDIKTYNVGGKYAGLSSGKLDRKNLHKYKSDKNIFYQNTYKQKECDLAFGIVLDASGSMSGSGIENGRITMIVLHETLKALGINHSIIDHTCYGRRYTSDLRRYQCFREDKGYRLKKNYALAEIRAQSGNCDSGALWFMEKALLRTKNKDKICLIFSDGAPTECSDADLVAQVKHMEHAGIKVIGIGIGFPNISKYYADYANGNNLKEMLDIVANILKDYVIAKKD